MKLKYDKTGAAIFLFVTSCLLFILLTLPFRVWLMASEITDMRITTALTPVVGIIFGFPAALGCAAGSFIMDMYSGYGISYALIGVVQQIIYGMVPYYLWKRINREHDGSQYKLDSLSRILKFCLVIVVDAVIMVVFSGIVNQAYSISDFMSINSLYMLLNCFDAGLIFGCPLMIVGHLLERYLERVKGGTDKKILTFSLNERMIINTIITGLGICILVGAAVYITDIMAESGSDVSVFGRIYIFETLALNFYFALSMGFMWFTEKRISRPVEHLAEIAENYYVEHSGDEDRKKFIDECAEYTSDDSEVGNLARSYVSMVEDLETYITNLKSVTAEKERINAELTLASDIQAHMLPCIFPAFPDYDEFDIYATMTPAKEVGGDFYDFFMTDENHLAFVMADVSGKGVPAALFMVIAKTLIKNYAQMGQEPGQVFTTVNRLLCDGNDAGLFVTAWIGILDLESGLLKYANAGHNPPLIKKAGGQFEYLRSRPGFVLAGMDTTRYRQSEMVLNPGDRIFLYTDGVTEATDSSQQLYGEDRLESLLNRCQADTAEEMLADLKNDIDSFVCEAPQFDDITMLMLDFKKRKAGEGMTERLFPADDSALNDVLAFAEEELEKAECPPKAMMQLTVAIEEVFVNVAHYAYPDEEGQVSFGIAFDSESRSITFRIADKGIAFNPLEKPDPDITLSAEEREIGGLGIFICKKTMDEIGYARENGENILTMTKKL